MELMIDPESKHVKNPAVDKKLSKCGVIQNLTKAPVAVEYVPGRQGVQVAPAEIFKTKISTPLDIFYLCECATHLFRYLQAEE